MGTTTAHPAAGPTAAAPAISGRSHGEIAFERERRRGDRGRGVRTVQEWLALHGLHLQADGVFGPATEHAVRQFQAARGREPTGIVDPDTWLALVEPMLRALSPLPADGVGFGELVARYARQHLAEQPREVGGQNRGPWVRLYMGGNEGRDWPWCAGFVSFLLRQAADAAGIAPPLPGSFSCDLLAAAAQRRGRFVAGADLARGRPPREAMQPGSIFLQRRSAGDWVHTGLVLAFGDEVFETVEGNTNDAGDREGYEVCQRIRGYTGKDFIRIDAP